MKNIRVSQDVFLFFGDGEVCLWNVRTGDNFLLEPAYAKRLMEVAFSGASESNPIDIELLKEHVLCERPGRSPWGWSKVSELFHFATRSVPGNDEFEDGHSFAKDYVEACAEVYKAGEDHELRTKKSGPIVELPAADLGQLDNASFWRALLERKTTREFFDEPLSLQDLSTVTFASFGEVHGEWSELRKRGLRILSTRKTSPSGGGIHPTDIYLLARNVEGLRPGIYFYQSDAHRLVELEGACLPPTVTALLNGQDFAEPIPALFVLATRFDRIWKKYRQSRAYRVALLDIGHLSQTFHLTAAAMELNSWLTAAFDDDGMARLLRLNPDTEDAMFILGVGRGSGDFMSASMRSALRAAETQRANGDSSRQ